MAMNRPQVSPWVAPVNATFAGVSFVKTFSAICRSEPTMVTVLIGNWLSASRSTAAEASWWVRNAATSVPDGISGCLAGMRFNAIRGSFQRW